MGKHRPKWLCTVCLKRRVPERGAVCYGCSRTLPNLPSHDDRSTPRVPPVVRGAR